MARVMFLSVDGNQKHLCVEATTDVCFSRKGLSINSDVELMTIYEVRHCKKPFFGHPHAFRSSALLYIPTESPNGSFGELPEESILIVHCKKGACWLVLAYEKTVVESKTDKIDDCERLFTIDDKL